MKKSDMEAHAEAYRTCEVSARAAIVHGLFATAIQSAVAAFPHIDGMLQLVRHEKREISSFPAIDIVLRYAPLLLDFHGLDSVEGLLEDCRRLQREFPDLKTRLAAARAELWSSHRLWDHVEQHGSVRQDELRENLGGGQDHWRGVAEAWEKMGLLGRQREGGSYRVSLNTRMGQLVSAKCPNCGHVASAPKAMLLESTTCEHCRKTCLFVILGAVSEAQIGG